MTRSRETEHHVSKVGAEVEDDISSSSDTNNNDLCESANVHVFSRSEAKARKQILKHGLKRMDGVVRVTMFRPKNVLFVISNPDVYKLSNSDVYIVFGQIKIEDMNSQAQLNAVQRLATTNTQNPKSSSVTLRASHSQSLIVEEEDTENLDETGLQSKDIDLVMDQTKVSRSKAVKALRDNNGDIVNAIMSIAI
ncbi:hypothetical protein PCK1_000537 [Pneumocystis canis]|nr:hypothetical protein PCK1_000537 [Pneumocystis canis]